MKKAALFFPVVIASASCSEPPVSNVEYNKGRERAEMEGCHCNAYLPRTLNKKEEVGQRKGWTDGYVEACIRFREEQGC
ncbi:MAG: hypothetical protein ACU843_16850 [Gammaproteobacteria bacterium]